MFGRLDWMLGQSARRRGLLPDAGNSMWGAGNLQTGARAGPFVSVRTHKSSLLRTVKVRLPFHCDWVADIREGPRRAIGRLPALSQPIQA
jgi:hypothetical protein